MKMVVSFDTIEPVTLVSALTGYSPEPDEIMARIRNDNPSRVTLPDWPWPNIHQTNEVFPYRPVKNGVVDTQSKITMHLKGTGWDDRFIEMMGAKMFWEKFTRNGYGWMDGDTAIETLRFNCIQCGGNLVHVTDYIGSYALVDYQNFYSPINHTLDYIRAPHLTIKQVLTKPVGWITDHNTGDVTFPAVCDAQPAIETSQLEYFPLLPFECNLGTVTRWLFYGSTTCGLINGEWVILEEMEEFGNSDGWQVYADPWMETCPPPMAGWTYS